MLRFLSHAKGLCATQKRLEKSNESGSMHEMDFKSSVKRIAFQLKRFMADSIPTTAHSLAQSAALSTADSILMHSFSGKRANT